jgi:hypothetical protein
MARANPGSGSHPGNLLSAFFGTAREGPDLPGAVPPRAGLRLLGGLLIAAMLHGAGVQAVPASHPVVSATRQDIGLSGPARLDASLWFDLPDPTGRQPLDQRRIDPPHRFSDGDAGIAGSDAEWLEKHNAPFILKGSSNAGLVVGADEFPSIFSLAAEHSGDIPARRHRHLRSPLRRCHPSART